MFLPFYSVGGLYAHKNVQKPTADADGLKKRAREGAARAFLGDATVGQLGNGIVAERITVPKVNTAKNTTRHDSRAKKNDTLLLVT